jgi:hypothetical protein
VFSHPEVAPEVVEFPLSPGELHVFLPGAHDRFRSLRGGFSGCGPIEFYWHGHQDYRKCSPPSLVSLDI